MFGKKKRELEEKLQQEREAHQRDLQELTELRAGLERKKKTIDEMQDALEQKLQEMDDRSKQFEEDRSRMLRETQDEIVQQRESFHKEMEQERTRTEQQLRTKLEAFSSNYSYYLSQLKLIMDILSKASITAGESFLLKDEADTTELFHEIFNKELDGQSILMTPQRTDSGQTQTSSEYRIESPETDPKQEERP